jgi:hypothetical protein
MQERQSGSDHPRSDDVKGRQEGGYDGGFGDRGYGDRGDFGDQGIGQSTRRESGQDQEGPPAGDGVGDADTTPPAGGGDADQADYRELPPDA